VQISAMPFGINGPNEEHSQGKRSCRPNPLHANILALPMTWPKRGTSAGQHNRIFKETRLEILEKDLEQRDAAGIFIRLFAT
jgi:hypothetical protein